MMVQKKLIAIFSLLVVLFIIYSYTQVDLNLTLSANSLYQSFQKPLTDVGYFNRPFSGMIFLALVISLFSFYGYCLYLASENKLTLGTTKWLIGVSTFLVCAYPAFSHDLFNYMFDARVVTTYGLDPHFFKALDFPHDEWTRFMHWTHRYYPYGPGWLWLTLIPSYFGIGKFVLTLGMYKLMFLLFHLGIVWLTWQVSHAFPKEKRHLAAIFYALNPLVLTESLVSPHNEVMLWFFALAGIYFLFNYYAVGAVIMLAISVSMKYISAVLFPLFWWVKPASEKFFNYAFWLWAVALVPLSLAREPYSWYVIPLVGLASLSNSKVVKVLTVSFSFGLILRYFPFLWWGEYTIRTEIWQLWSLIIGTTVCAVILFKLWKKPPF